MSLLDNHSVQKSKPVQSAIDDLLGAVYSLVHAKGNRFKNRTGHIEVSVVRTRATQIHLGVVRSDGFWIAGWHFNSALYRLAAIYHRLLKVVAEDLHSATEIPELVKDAELFVIRKTKRHWHNKHVHKIYLEVNVLKHNAHGLYFGRRATYDDAVSAVEELLQLVEAWAG